MRTELETLPAWAQGPGPGTAHHRSIASVMDTYIGPWLQRRIIVQELCEGRGGRPGLSVLTSLLVSVDVKLY